MDENTNPLRNPSLYVGLVVIAVMVLLTFGAFKIYQARTKKPTSIALQTPSPASSAKTNAQLPSPSSVASPSPVLGTNTASPQSLPASGSQTQEVSNAGISTISPVQGQKITSPIQVTGMANVLGDLQITIKDSNGNVLGQGSAKACLGTNACPFAATVDFSKAQTKTGAIEISAPQDSSNYAQVISIAF